MSKEIWEKNLKAMEKWYPPFADMIREKRSGQSQQTGDEIEISLEQSWDGEQIFRIKKEDRSLYLNGKRDAKEPVQTWLKRLGKLHKYAPVFLFGLGSGAYLKALVQNTDKEVNIVAYEPSLSIFTAMLEETDLSEEIKDRPIAFVVEGVNEEEFEAILGRVVAVESLEFLKEEIHPNYRVFYREKILKYMKMLQRMTEDIRVGFNSGELFSGDLAKNVLYNMRYICEGYHTKNLFDAVPHDGAAILVAAGPSLNKNIKELKKAKNKAFIVAVDTAVKPLLKAGVAPDAFMTIDPRKPLELLDMDGARDIPIIAPTCARHSLIENQKGKKIFFFDGYVIPFRAYKKNGKQFYNVSLGGSVACSVFSLLYKMGFQTIILVGQDLAYTNNRSHADGTFAEKMKEENTEGMIMVKGNYEEKVPTITNLRIYLEWFEMYIEGMKKRREVRVINATEGGAYIKGTELMTLKEAVAENCKEEIDLEACIEKMKPEFTEEEQRNAAEYLRSIPGKYDEIINKTKLLKKAYRNLDKASRSGNLQKESCRKLLKKIRQLTDECQGNDGFQLIEITMPTAEYIVRSEYYYEGSNIAEEMQEVARKGMKYSELLKKCAELLKSITEDVLRYEPFELDCGSVSGSSEEKGA